MMQSTSMTLTVFLICATAAFYAVIGRRGQIPNSSLGDNC